MTNKRIDYQIIHDSQGNPAFAVLPYADLERLLHPIDLESGVPSDVVDLALDNGYSALRAWREYLGLSQKEVAQRANMSQSGYSQLEKSDNLRPATRAKLALALGIHPEQLDF